MNQLTRTRIFRSLRFLIAITACLLAAPLGVVASLAIGAGSLLINPFTSSLIGMAAYPAISGSTKAQILTLSPEGEEVLWEKDIIASAAQQSPFADNMTGGPGSGKPLVNYTGTKNVLGTSIVISTVDSLGSPIVQGNGIRVGQEEQVKPGDFLLKTSIGWIGTGIDNTGTSQTVIGASWDALSKKLIARRLAKQQSDDAMVNLKHSAFNGATPLDNVVFPNGKTIDTLSTADTYSYSLVVKSGGTLRDIGAIPMNAAPNPDSASSEPPVIQRYMQFGTDANMRPIKTDTQYLEAIKFAKERGDTNNLFTGDYSDVDGNIVYPWVTVRHGGYGSIGAAIQPEALLGTAIVAKSTSSTVTQIDGGGNTTAAAVTPLRNYFEFFSRFTYTPINGVTSSFAPRATYGYLLIVDKTAGLVSFLRYTTNSGNVLTGIKRLGSTSTGDYLTTLGDVTWDAGAFTVAGDNNGYLGVSEGIIASGSKIYEANSKGVPLAFAFGLGEMALVCGYGRVPINNGASFKTMANRTMYTAPHGQAFANGLEVAYGTAAFLRPDGLAPNFTLNVFSRGRDSAPGLPNVS